MEMTMYLQVECMCSINKTEKSGNVCDLLLRWRRKGKRNWKARTERRNEWMREEERGRATFDWALKKNGRRQMCFMWIELLGPGFCVLLGRLASAKLGAGARWLQFTMAVDHQQLGARRVFVVVGLWPRRSSCWLLALFIRRRRAASKQASTKFGYMAAGLQHKSPTQSIRPLARVFSIVLLCAVLLACCWPVCGAWRRTDGAFKAKATSKLLATLIAATKMCMMVGWAHQRQQKKLLFWNFKLLLCARCAAPSTFARSLGYTALKVAGCNAASTITMMISVAAERWGTLPTHINERKTK